MLLSFVALNRFRIALFGLYTVSRQMVAMSRTKRVPVVTVLPDRETYERSYNL
jgi:hypothetical protein